MRLPVGGIAIAEKGISAVQDGRQRAYEGEKTASKRYRCRVLLRGSFLYNSCCFQISCCLPLPSCLGKACLKSVAVGWRRVYEQHSRQERGSQWLFPGLVLHPSWPSVRLAGTPSRRRWQRSRGNMVAAPILTAAMISSPLLLPAAPGRRRT